MGTPRIVGAIRRDDTIRRLGGQGDNWYSTWGADGALYIALCDGWGFPSFAADTGWRLFNSRLCRVEGHPEGRIEFFDVPGYPDLAQPLRGSSDESAAEPAVPRTRYYSFGTLAVDGAIYQFLSTADTPNGTYPQHFVGAKLIYSPDGGATWHNQDGSTPVVWEGWDRSPADMAFSAEPGETFSLLSILQMGRDYGLNTDGFVYVYAPDGNTEGTMNRLVMFRVAKDRILDRSAYEYFAGRREDGSARWSHDIADRAAVHEFPAGWVNADREWTHPYAWQPSVTFDPGLGLYLMANWATGPSSEGEWFGKPSYLGLYSAPEPWGPWQQFHEDTAWAPGGDLAARCYQPQIVPSWIAEDGRSFWLVWTDFQSPIDVDTFIARHGALSASGASDAEVAENLRVMRPHYAFNLQRIDLVLEGDGAA